LANFPHWTSEPESDAVTVNFEVADFLTAFPVMTQITRVADELDHHPEWSNIYNNAHIRLTTHKTGRLSQRDMKMTRVIDIEACDCSTNPENCARGNLFDFTSNISGLKYDNGVAYMRNYLGHRGDFSQGCPDVQCRFCR
jgi:4a-hydroxytetrahydrobiopterin dehydratase